MQFGLFSNGERQNQVAKITYDEDLAEVILADELGLQERGSASTEPSSASTRLINCPAPILLFAKPRR